MSQLRGFMMYRTIIKRYATVLLPLLMLGLSACTEDYAIKRNTSDRPNSRHAHPYYREYGPWDLPPGNVQPGHVQPGPPTWYGCPQGSKACYSD
jgi:hypothetical protein